MGQHLPRSWLRHNRASPAGITIPGFWNKTEAVAISAPAASQKLLELAFLLRFKLFKLNVTLFSKRFGCQQLKAQSCFDKGCHDGYLQIQRCQVPGSALTLNQE